MNSRIEARVSHRFKAPAERVYDAWLDPAQVRAWMAAALKSSATASGGMTLSFSLALKIFTAKVVRTIAAR